MNNTLSEEAVELGVVLGEALEAAGGVDLARSFEAEPAGRSQVANSILDPFGIWEIDPTEDQVQLEAAAEVCRVAGSNLLMYPIAERLSRPPGYEALMLIPSQGPLLAVHGDIDLAWAGATLDGRSATITSTGSPIGEKLTAFIAPVTAKLVPGRREPHAALGIVLQSWWLLGVLERAVADTITYTNERKQFGRELIKFQGTQFALSDTVVAVQGLAEIAKYSLWSVARSPADVALVDAVALRVEALRCAEPIARTAHQLHGAMGFADETNVSQYDRHSQGVRRLPEGTTNTQCVLLELVTRAGWSSLFPIDPTASPATAMAVVTA